MKNIIRKIMSITLCMSILSMFTTVIFASNKDETIYANLNYDGSVGQIEVVNHIYNIEEESIEDYGKYLSIENLTNTLLPTINGEKIQWSTIDKKINDFYYSGKIDSPLPVSIEIKYKLNGKEVDAKDLAGSNGEVSINISIKQNLNCREDIRKGLMTQISLPLELGKVSKISYEKGTAVTVGKTVNISYTVLPEKNEEFILTFKAKDFEMSSINITLLKSVIDFSEEVDSAVNEIEDGFDDMAEGMSEIKDGTIELKNGLHNMVDSTNSLDNGLKNLTNENDNLKEGLSSFSGGINELLSNSQILSASSKDFKQGLEELSIQLDPIITGYQEAEIGLKELLSKSQSLQVLANNVLNNPSSTETELTLAQGIIGLLEGIDVSSVGLIQLNSGLIEYKDGINLIVEGYIAINNGLQTLPSGISAISDGLNNMSKGINSYLNGVSDISIGINQYNKSVKNLPQEVQKLAKGQQNLLNGIIDAKGEISEKVDNMMPQTNTKPVSFVSPDKNNPTSVQYLMITPAIEKEKPTKKHVEEKLEKSFWHRFINLFKR